MKTGKPVVLVLFAGRPMTLKWENDNVPAILNVWFGGSEAGNAIADVLFGRCESFRKIDLHLSAKCWPAPLYYAQKNTGRPLGKWFEKFRSNCLDVSNDPVYPFGYGLSYTTFKYSDIKLSSTNLKGNQQLTASVTVSNTGNIDGKETVQLYIRDLVGSVTRPLKELKDSIKFS